MRSKIFAVAVDDDELNLTLIKEISEKADICVTPFVDPKEGLEFAVSNEIDMVFADYKMPQMDGIEFITEIRKVHSDIPVVMITGINDYDVMIKAIEAGATEFIIKPINAVEFLARINNLAELRTSQILLQDRAKLLEEEVWKATVKLRQREKDILFALGLTAEHRDPESSQHIKRVGYYSKLLLGLYGASEHEQDIIFHAAPLHDVGKVGVKDEILHKEGRLSQEEMLCMQEHVHVGYEILRKIDSKYLQHGAIIALSHHERYDGSGYPYRLKGDDIPLFGRIVALVDVFDALTSKRPYKGPWSFDDAVAYIVEGSGSLFDPEIVTLFSDHIDDVREIYLKYNSPLD